jgi:hypothetical protein
MIVNAGEFECVYENDTGNNLITNVINITNNNDNRYIEYIFDNQVYYYPIRQFETVKFPIYSYKDLYTSPKIEIISIDIISNECNNQNIIPNEKCTDIIAKYKGPKNNFHTDTGITQIYIHDLNNYTIKYTDIFDATYNISIM